MSFLEKNKLLIYAGIGVVVVVVVVAILMKKKESYVYNPPSGTSTGTATNSLTLVSDTNGNLSTVSTVPIGTIVAWYGSTSTIPTGWVLCDGTNGTPNMVGSFPIGANGDFNTGTSASLPLGAIQNPSLSVSAQLQMNLQQWMQDGTIIPDGQAWNGKSEWKTMTRNVYSPGSGGGPAVMTGTFPYSYIAINWIMKVS